MPSWCLLTMHLLIKTHVAAFFYTSSVPLLQGISWPSSTSEGLSSLPPRCVGGGLQSESFVLRPKADVETISHTCCWLSHNHLCPSNKASHFHRRHSPVSY